MQYAVKYLDGELLNAAVAKAEGLPTHPGRDRYVVATKIDHCWADQFEFLSWPDAGPIIEREQITLESHDDSQWTAWIARRGVLVKASTPLIAAMRAYVASKLGVMVELP